ncbi:MAG: 23S rRNA (guanosine(2251)-2'-O)-methyltransferase RlmB [Candidatus Omnitrophica bacterium]|nr:23S rRNA (guanosine(2251)-2'-O)-methyltransferase RlmB [Candidatus Omnitrophota bacterium]
MKNKRLKIKKPGKDTMLLYGKNSVIERLKKNPRSINKIFLRDNYDEPDLERLIKNRGLSLERVSAKRLEKIKHSKDLQGIVASVDKFGYADFDDLLDSPEKRSFIFLDRINDPQNLGVIIRTAACFGDFNVVIPKFEACPVTEAVLHVASGAENYIPVSMVTNLTQAMLEAKKKGFWIVGGVVSEEAEYINRISLPFPLGLVLGFEGKGIRYGVEKHLDIKARIPMKGTGLSFNVAVACAIFCYEIVRQRGDIK